MSENRSIIKLSERLFSKSRAVIEVALFRTWAVEPIRVGWIHSTSVRSVLACFVINGEPYRETRTLPGFSFAGQGDVTTVAVDDLVTYR